MINVGFFVKCSLVLGDSIVTPVGKISLKLFYIQTHMYYRYQQQIVNNKVPYNFLRHRYSYFTLISPSPSELEPFSPFPIAHIRSLVRCYSPFLCSPPSSPATVPFCLLDSAVIPEQAQKYADLQLAASDEMKLEMRADKMRCLSGSVLPSNNLCQFHLFT